MERGVNMKGRGVWGESIGTGVMTLKSLRRRERGVWEEPSDSAHWGVDRMSEKRVDGNIITLIALGFEMASTVKSSTLE